MHQETPTAVAEGQTPFDLDGNFNVEKAIDLALEHRGLGDVDAANALDLLIDFFSTSENYIFNGDNSLNYKVPSGVTEPIFPESPA